MLLDLQLLGSTLKRSRWVRYQKTQVCCLNLNIYFAKPPLVVSSFKCCGYIRGAPNRQTPVWLFAIEDYRLKLHVPLVTNHPSKQGFVDKDEDSRLLKAAKMIFAPFSGLPLWLPLAILTAPQFRPFFLLASKVLGATQVDDVMTARGYLWGTSSALLHNSNRKDGEEKPEQKQDERYRVPSGMCPASASGFLDGLKDHANVVPPPYNLMTRLTKAANRDTQAPFTDTDICAQGFTFLLAGYVSFECYVIYMPGVLESLVPYRLFRVLSLGF
jgi:hypothetical protein